MAFGHFVTLSKPAAAKVRAQSLGPRRGLGAVGVKVTIGATSWKTSIVPDSKSRSYLLPIKAGVRRREDISAGDTVKVTIAVEDASKEFWPI